MGIPTFKISMWHHLSNIHPNLKPLTFHFLKTTFFISQKNSGRSVSLFRIQVTRSLPPILPKVPPSLGAAERICQPRFAKVFWEDPVTNNHISTIIGMRKSSLFPTLCSRTFFSNWFMADLRKIIKYRDQHGFYARCNQLTHHLFSDVHRLGSQISPQRAFRRIWQLANWWPRKDENEVFECVFVFLFICIYIYTVCICIKTIFMMFSSFH